VLGTRFDVGAYPEDGAVRVVVAEGTVSVRSEREGTESGVRVKERQMASLSKSDRSVLRQEVDPAPYLAWTKGQLVFKDATFDQVVRRLNTWYGLEADLEGSTEAVHHLNAAFEGEPVGEVLTVIAETLDLRYEREGKRVTFYVEE
jgi:ferric-dicitrate binding protein FerR (iron transport regulator)